MQFSLSPLILSCFVLSRVRVDFPCKRTLQTPSTHTSLRPGWQGVPSTTALRWRQKKFSPLGMQFSSQGFSAVRGSSFILVQMYTLSIHYPKFRVDYAASQIQKYDYFRFTSDLRNKAATCRVSPGRRCRRTGSTAPHGNPWIPPDSPDGTRGGSGEVRRQLRRITDETLI